MDDPRKACLLHGVREWLKESNHLRHLAILARHNQDPLADQYDAAATRLLRRARLELERIRCLNPTRV